MSKQTIEVEVPEGFTAVGAGLPNRGDYFVGKNGEVQMCIGDSGTVPVLIVEHINARHIDSWQPPPFLRKGLYLAKDADGSWHFYATQPVQHEKGWTGNGSLVGNASIFAELTGMTLPVCEDWRESLRYLGG